MRAKGPKRASLPRGQKLKPESFSGFPCPQCDAPCGVLDSRRAEGRVRRRRCCSACNLRFTTFELIHGEDLGATVEQKDLDRLASIADYIAAKLRNAGHVADWNSVQGDGLRAALHQARDPHVPGK
jgi:transcriptional regulator NrdR family protein